MINKKIKPIDSKSWSDNRLNFVIAKVNLLITAHNEKIDSNKLDIFPRDTISKEKSYYFVNSKGAICSSVPNAQHTPDRKKFGNYFKTQKEAKEARERMVKLFARVKKAKAKKKVISKTKTVSTTLSLFYCVMCRQRREGAEVTTVTMKNGKQAEKARCKVCGTTMFHIKP